MPRGESIVLGVTKRVSWLVGVLWENLPFGIGNREWLPNGMGEAFLVVGTRILGMNENCFRF